ncbi:hypothetical protein DFH08DRAFT_825656 [Mycena albidolilacea]|uniref:Uncharacterized protein n=1 Tax=Mycena albidolilacea TaxID=1033008 RepID=A0AAD6Z208_9AGAR|nr:hypothetical protein DFH08DRAFT_825656 [Mycena albidolilacea]
MVFTTQRLATRGYLQTERTLTATHDNLTAWAGIGAALGSLYGQISVPASVIGTLSVFAYLGCAEILHITTPAILSVEVFNMSVSTPVPTQWLPQTNASNPLSVIVSMQNSLHFLPWIGNIKDSQTIGLSNGTLYEEIQDFYAGEARVSAIGFNISCGYLKGSNTKSFRNGGAPRQWDITLDVVDDISVYATGPNILTVLSVQNNSIVLLTTSTVVDSEGGKGSSISLTPPMSTGLTTVTHVQCLRCFKTVVAQKGIIDAKSGRVDPESLSPNLQKTFSKWHVPDGSGSDNQFVNASLIGGSAWLDILSQAGDLTQSSVPMDTDLPSEISYLSFVDVFKVMSLRYLMDRLALDPWWILPESDPWLNGSSISGSNQTLSLQEIENALSSLVASAFWIGKELGGHIHPGNLSMKYTNNNDRGVITSNRPVLSSGIVDVQHFMLSARMNIGIGLCISIVLMIFAAGFCRGSSDSEKDSIQGTGILHTIWLFVRNPELHRMARIEFPSDHQLRIGGLARIQLVKPQPDEKPAEEDDRDSESEPNPICNKEDKTAPLPQGQCSRLNPKWFSAAACVGVLHVGLVLIHLALLAVWAAHHMEHKIIFRLDDQVVVSLITTILTTTLGTVTYFHSYYTQTKLASRGYWQTERTLTATHDNLAAWNGVGAAMSVVYNQFSIPASVTGSICILGYLASILILGVTTPALFSIQVFNLTLSSTMPTQGAPQLNKTDPKWVTSSLAILAHKLLSVTYTFIENSIDFISWIGNLDESHTVGLYNGTLYDAVAELTPTGGASAVSGIGFNITCGYLPGVQDITLLAEQFIDARFCVAGPNLLLLASLQPPDFDHESQDTWTESIILFTSNPILDSSDNSGYPVNLNPPMVVQSTTSSHLQLIKCSKSLVNQTAMVDSQSGTIIPASLRPNIHKNTSMWKPYSSPPHVDPLASNDSLINSNYWSGVLLGYGSAWPAEVYDNTSIDIPAIQE